MYKKRLLSAAVGLVAAATVAQAATGCGDDSHVDPLYAGDAADGSQPLDDAGDGAVGFGDGATCISGSACGDGGVCTGGSCCSAALACADSCCGAGQLCSFQKCVTPGGPCVDSTDCAKGDYCDQSLSGGDAGAPSDASCNGGKPIPVGRCLPRPPICAPDAGAPDGGAISCLEACEYHPPASAFDPVVKYAWGGASQYPFSTDVMMAPIVAQLDDDNCDGKVTADDIPEIIFSTFTAGGYYKQGTLHAISIVGGKIVDKWSLPNVVQPGGGLAAADLDGDGVSDIVGCADPGPVGSNCCNATAQNTGVVAFKADGSVLWTQNDTTKVHCGYEAPAIGDLDQDGIPEVLVGLTILDGKTGAIKKELDPLTSWGARLTGLTDLDGDGKLDIVDGDRAFRGDGTLLWDLRTGPDAITRGYHAVGDLDKDGKPEVVVISSAGPHKAFVLRYNAASPSHVDVIRRDIDINNGVSTKTFCNVGNEYGGGPPTIADFNGDGFPDVGAAGAVGYMVLSGAALMNPATPNAGTVLWSKPTHDCSSAVTGSSVFDFNGDGQAEVIYSDEFHLWMYDGKTGNNLIPSTCNTTGTLWEYPLVADVDNDGQADIVVASNGYGVTCPDNASKQSGIRIFQSASKSWVRSRRVWNEHTYHVTNVSEDGKVPAVETANWSQSTLNNYRQNKQPGSEFAAPDAIISLQVDCSNGYALVASVRNVGEATLPAGQLVSFFEGASPSGTPLGQATTSIALGPAQAESIKLPLANPPADIQTSKVYATVTVALPTNQCRVDNDVSPQVSGICQVVN